MKTRTQTHTQAKGRGHQAGWVQHKHINTGVLQRDGRSRTVYISCDENSSSSKAPAPPTHACVPVFLPPTRQTKSCRVGETEGDHHEWWPYQVLLPSHHDDRETREELQWLFRVIDTRISNACTRARVWTNVHSPPGTCAEAHMQGRDPCASISWSYSKLHHARREAEGL